MGRYVVALGIFDRVKVVKVKSKHLMQLPRHWGVFLLLVHIVCPGKDPSRHPKLPQRDEIGGVKSGIDRRHWNGDIWSHDQGFS